MYMKRLKIIHIV